MNKLTGPGVLLACLMLCGLHSFASQPLSDRELLKSNEIRTPTDSGGKISFMEAGGDRLTARLNPVRLSLGGMMYVYQRFVSPQLPSECLYHPSCSGFSMALVRDLGLVRGVAATADRLTRCNRVAALDIHPLHIDEASGKVREDTRIYERSAYD